jgi:hypothetical protein
MSTNTNGSKRKTAGKILLWIGIAGIIISFIAIFEGCSAMTNMDDPEHMGPVILGSLGILISLHIIALGLGLQKTGGVTLVCGILSSLYILSAYFLSHYITPYGIILSLLAIIFGAVSLVRTKRDPTLGGRNMAIASLVIGTIVLVAVIVIFIIEPWRLGLPWW